MKTKMKTHSGAKKRLKVNKNGKVKKSVAFGSHLLSKKSMNRKRKYRKNVEMSAADKSGILRLMPYVKK